MPNPKPRCWGLVWPKEHGKVVFRQRGPYLGEVGLVLWECNPVTCEVGRPVFGAKSQIQAPVAWIQQKKCGGSLFLVQRTGVGLQKCTRGGI